MKQSFINFKKPIILNLSCKVKDSIKLEDLDYDSESKPCLKFRTSIKKHKSESEAIVALSFDFNEETKPFVIHITMGTKVKWGKGVSDDIVEQILKSNVPTLLLSYIRPLVSQITNYSQFGSLEIPFCDFSGSIEVEEVDSTEDMVSDSGKLSCQE